MLNSIMSNQHCGSTAVELEWIDEEDPSRNYRPALCLHSCGIRDRLSLISENRHLGDGVHEVDSLYMLKWFSTIGPSFGLLISPECYIRISNALEPLLIR